MDQFLNLKLHDISKVVQNTPNSQNQFMNELPVPHLASVKHAFIRGSVVRYVHLDKDKVDTELLQDASRREAESGSVASKKQQRD